MLIEKKLLKDLKPAPYNPRQSTAKQEAQLKRSLEKFGVVEPIIWNKQTGYIVGGHFRVRELHKLGYKEIDCVIVDLNEEDEKELNIRLNANTGEWDWDSLANEWDVEKLDDWGLNIPNYSLGLDVNDMTEEDIDIEEEFDPIGVSKGLTRLVIIFDNITIANEWIEKNNLNIEYKKRGNDENIILQVNMSSNYGI